VLLLVPLASSAQYLPFPPPDVGPYVRFDLEPTFPNDGRLTAFGAFPTGNTVRYKTGFASTVAGRYGFTPWIAAELEFGWRWNEISQVQGFTLAETFFDQVSFLANVVLQSPLPRTRLVPHIGVGYKYFASDDSSYRFESLLCCRPDLHLRFEGMSMHMVTGNITLKY
jgi:hypothetical protein